MMAGLTQEELGNFLQDEIFDPHLLASCSDDETIKLWKIE